MVTLEAEEALVRKSQPIQGPHFSIRRQTHRVDPEKRILFGIEPA